MSFVVMVVHEFIIIIAFLCTVCQELLSMMMKIRGSVQSVSRRRIKSRRRKTTKQMEQKSSNVAHHIDRA